MLVTRWDKPIVFEDDGLRISVGSPEEALTWLSHTPNQTSRSWRHAWKTCVAVQEGRRSPDDAKVAVEQAVSSTRH
ncbi:DUF982 domain-containing protein [Rhizobium sp. LC145]|uniref:DUF982 domain-containing protein n=1 Tax=Rhizobium sp. LC145 TaxID=1120688 RepID=UPI0009E27ECD|nr:DUF982 domain-containing protein [Rhizobium sp. LC145]TKT67114.1 DUF982 domain-containing protein [Rhizobiaceae bacterium LC148]